MKKKKKEKNEDKNS